jgi:hypothetical protein
MKEISLEIERLVLRGGGFPASGPSFARMAEREIIKMLSESGYLEGIQAADVTRIAAAPIRVNGNVPPEKFAQTVARSICGGVAGKKGWHG